MKKQVLFVQGGGDGAYRADAVLAASLGSALGPDYDVRYPVMPDEASPHYPAWRRCLLEEFSGLGGDAVLVGHSLGASILLKTLVDCEDPPAVKALFLIAGPYWGGEGWNGWKEVELSDEETARLSKTFALFLYHGRDDETVPHAHLDLYAKALPGAKVRSLAGRNHQLNNDLSEIAADIKDLG